MRVVLLRTAEHVSAIAGTWPTSDTQLTPCGLRQGGHLAEHLARQPLTSIYSSPTVRCVQTVSLLSTMTSLAVREAPELDALNMGVCAGMTHEAAHVLVGDEMWAELLTSPDPQKRYFNGGETLQEVADRACAKLSGIVANSREEDVVVLCTHEEVIGAILCKAAGMPLAQVWWWGSTSVPSYASTSELLWRGGRSTLLRFGCAGHLEQP